MSGRTFAWIVTEWGGPEVLQVLHVVAIPEPQKNQVGTRPY